jgi:hypothetical protein
MTTAELDLPTRNVATPSTTTMKALLDHALGKRAWKPRAIGMAERVEPDPAKSQLETCRNPVPLLGQFWTVATSAQLPVTL